MALDPLKCEYQHNRGPDALWVPTTGSFLELPGDVMPARPEPVSLWQTPISACTSASVAGVMTLGMIRVRGRGRDRSRRARFLDMPQACNSSLKKKEPRQNMPTETASHACEVALGVPGRARPAQVCLQWHSTGSAVWRHRVIAQFAAGQAA
jgi:hypothetical protein